MCPCCSDKLKHHNFSSAKICLNVTKTQSYNISAHEHVCCLCVCMRLFTCTFAEVLTQECAPGLCALHDWIVKNKCLNFPDPFPTTPRAFFYFFNAEMSYLPIVQGTFK